MNSPDLEAIASDVELDKAEILYELDLAFFRVACTLNYLDDVRNGNESAASAELDMIQGLQSWGVEA